MENEQVEKVDYDEIPLMGGPRTVTITLAEYRELVIAKTTLEILQKKEDK